MNEEFVREAAIGPDDTIEGVLDRSLPVIEPPSLGRPVLVDIRKGDYSDYSLHNCTPMCCCNDDWCGSN